MYKLFNDIKTGELSSVFNIETNTSIPLNPDNADYQAYLAWVAEGNTPIPADEDTQ
jgi:hypothetical protein